MSGDISYTTEEIAKLLKISKLTVYDLIKKGELPSYRVGKQMRVDAADLEAYKSRAKEGARLERVQPSNVVEPAARTPVSRALPAASAGMKPIVITGQDMSLDLVARRLEQDVAGCRPLREYVGSLDSLVAMYRGEADIVSTHLWDGDTNEYNLPYIRRLLIGSSYVVVHLLTRQAGLYVRQGNPLGLAGWRDLGRPGLRLANRERGSGARVLLDEQLRLHGIRPDRLDGYDRVQTNHIAVAAQVASGQADVGVGIEKAAALVGAVEFIPLIRESYDLVALKNRGTEPWLPSLLRLLRSADFKRELGAIAGYDLSRTGEIRLET